MHYMLWNVRAAGNKGRTVVVYHLCNEATSVYLPLAVEIGIEPGQCVVGSLWGHNPLGVGLALWHTNMRVGGWGCYVHLGLVLLLLVWVNGLFHCRLYLGVCVSCCCVCHVACKLNTTCLQDPEKRHKNALAQLVSDNPATTHAACQGAAKLSLVLL